MLRIARTARKAGDSAKARSSWRRILSLPDSAATAAARLALVEWGAAPALDLYRDLISGRFPLARESYFFYSGQVKELVGEAAVAEFRRQEQRRIALTEEKARPRGAVRSLRCRLLHAGQTGVDALDRGVRLVDVHLNDEFELIVVGHASAPERQSARSHYLQFRKFANKLNPSAQNESRPLPGRGRIVPISGMVQRAPAKVQNKCFLRLERLREVGHELRRPEADFLRDGIYELRVSLQGVHHRVLYFFHGTVAAVVSHGLIKERVVPPKEIDRAIERRKRFEGNPRRHTYEET